MDIQCFACHQSDDVKDWLEDWELAAVGMQKMNCEDFKSTSKKIHEDGSPDKMKK